MLRKQTQTNPIQTQNKPNHKKAENERNLCYTKELRRYVANHPPKKQTQTNPIKSQMIRLSLPNTLLFVQYAYLTPLKAQTNPITKRPKMNVNEVLTERYDDYSHI